MLNRCACLLAAWALAVTGCTHDPLPPQPPLGPRLVVTDRMWSYRGAQGQEIITPHYHLFTTHSDPQFIERLPLFMETAFVYYQQLIKPTRVPSEPMQVFVFGRRDQWERFTVENTVPAAANTYLKIQEGGYVDNGRAVFYDIHHLKTFAVTGHECFHQYIWHYTKHRPPAWLDESLACYFEGFHWQDRSLRFEPKRNYLRLTALRYGLTEKTLLDLNELLSTHPGNIIGGSAGRVASYYAQLWALALFLQNEPAYQPKFRRLLDDVGSQRMLELAAAEGYRGAARDFGPAVFRAYISRDLATFRSHFHAYCVKLAF